MYALPKKWQQQCMSLPSALILGHVQMMKMIVLIQHAEKKENSYSKRYEMSKWNFGYAIPMTGWNTVQCHIALYYYWNSWQRTNEWWTVAILSRTFLTKEPICNLALEIYASFPKCVCYFYYCCCTIICQILGCWDIVTEQTFSKNISTIWYV